MSEPVEVRPGEGVPAYRVTTFREPRHRYALVIPVLNEGDRIRRQLAALHEADVPADVYLADGGSTDGSTAPAELSAAGVTALLVKTGPGKLSAQLRMGFHHVLGLPYDGVVTMDGNGKDGVEGVARIVAALESGLDFVQGSRFVRGGTAENTPLLRHLAVVLVHAPVTSLAARHRFTDTTNGFRGHSRRLLVDPRVAIFRDVFDTYELLAYLPIRAARLGYRVGEVPVARRYPPTGRTPTKIHGLSGNARLLRILLGAATHRFDPEPVADASPGTAPARFGPFVRRLSAASRRALRQVLAASETQRYEIWYRVALALLERAIRPTSTTAVVVHVYYTDVWPLLAASLRRLHVPHDLVVSLPVRNIRFISDVRAAFPAARIVIVPNRGRDVLPFLAIASVLVRHRYDIVLKVHSKRSPHFEGGRAWLELLLDRLLPGTGMETDLVRRLHCVESGVAGPAELYVPLSTYLDENRGHLGDILAEVVGQNVAGRVLADPAGHGFFAGTMFWARLDAIEPLTRFGPRDFEVEAGQADGTFAHALERAFTVLPSLTGRRNLEISAAGVGPRAAAASNPPSWFME